jgi:hypothetical protein
MRDESIERLRSKLAHAHDQETGNSCPAPDFSRARSFSVPYEELEQLRSLLVHAHDPEKVSPVRRIMLRITERLIPFMKRPKQVPGENKDAA